MHSSFSDNQQFLQTFVIQYPCTETKDYCADYFDGVCITHTHQVYPFESGDMFKIQTESNNQSTEYFDSIVTTEAGLTHVKLCRHTEVFMGLQSMCYAYH